MSSNPEKVEGQEGTTPPAPPETPPVPPTPPAQQPSEPPKVKLALAAGRPPAAVSGTVHIGSHGAITLPSLEEQRAGFELPQEDAMLLQAQYGLTYKRVVPLVGAVPVPEEGGEENDE
jgi:hypothetical protein